jgi:hypothetical protein
VEPEAALKGSGQGRVGLGLPPAAVLVSLLLGYLALVNQVLKVAIQSFILHLFLGLGKGVFHLLLVNAQDSGNSG